MLRMLADLNKDLEKVLEEMEKISGRPRPPPPPAAGPPDRPEFDSQLAAPPRGVFRRLRTSFCRGQRRACALCDRLRPAARGGRGPVRGPGALPPARPLVPLETGEACGGGAARACEAATGLNKVAVFAH